MKDQRKMNVRKKWKKKKKRKRKRKMNERKIE